MSEQEGRRELWTWIAGALALLVCCGAPLLIAALAASGLGVAFLSEGTLVLGAFVLAVAAALGWRYLTAPHADRREKAELCAFCGALATGDHRHEEGTI